MLYEVITRKSDSNGTKSGLKSIDELLDDVRQDCSEIRNAKAQSRTPNLNRLPKAVLGANPLEREKMIMQLQWDELESAGANETFTRITSYNVCYTKLLRDGSGPY